MASPRARVIQGFVVHMGLGFVFRFQMTFESELKIIRMGRSIFKRSIHKYEYVLRLNSNLA